MHISRAAMLRAAALTALSSAPLGLAPRRTLAEEKMKTSESFGSFEELTGVQFQALGAGAGTRPAHARRRARRVAR